MKSRGVAVSVLIVFILGITILKAQTPLTVEDIDGNVYSTVKIGNQIWTDQNLRTTRFNDGSEIPLVKDSAKWAALQTPAYCYYNNSKYRENNRKYGALYNWYAVDTKILAPKGWHVATEEDWDILINYLIANGYNWDGTTKSNKIAKSLASNTGWDESQQAGTIGNDMATNNKSGFLALPGGCRFENSKFIGMGGMALWWSARGPADVHVRAISSRDTLLLSSYTKRVCGYSVRLVKNIYNICEAIREKNYDTIKYLVNNGADLDEQFKFVGPKNYGDGFQDYYEYPVKTLLDQYDGKFICDVLKLFYIKGYNANLWLHTSENVPILHQAVVNKSQNEYRYEIVKLLLENKADVNIKDYYGNNVFSKMLDMHIHEQEDLNMIKLLIENGADLSAKDLNGMTPMKYAKKHDAKKDLLELLKKK